MKRIFGKEIIIETTNRCNLNCKLCNHSEMKREKRDMSFKTFLKIMGELPRVRHITFDLGGEPLLNPATLKMVTYARKKGIKTFFSTNGYFLEENVDEILYSGLDKILIDLDGTTKKSYEFYRVGSDFEKVKRGIKLLCQEKKRRRLKKPLITIGFLVMKTNEHQIEDMKKLFKELGADELLLKSLHYSWDSKDSMKKFIPKNKRFVRETIDNSKPCSWSKRIVVLSNGDITSCCYDILGENVFGDVSDLMFAKEYYEKVRDKKFNLCIDCPVDSDFGEVIK